mmetsp:Transcript_42006/g.80342  ORF Transcript_42006/g.80342 Transcript_42006/m.80342 type:complete len:310 (+) Transcript_42006:949-1878(+)
MRMQVLFLSSMFSSSAVFRRMLPLHSLSSCTTENLRPKTPLVVDKCLNIFLTTYPIQHRVCQAITKPLTGMLESVAWAVYDALIKPSPTVEQAIKPSPIVERAMEQDNDTRSPRSSACSHLTEEVAAVPLARASSVAEPDTFNAVKRAYMTGAVTRSSGSTHEEKEEVSTPLDVVAIPMVIHHPTEGVKIVSLGPKCVRQTDFLPPVSLDQCDSASASVDAPTPPNTPKLGGSKSQKGLRCFNRLSSLGRQSSPGLTIRDAKGQIVSQQSPRAPRLSQESGLCMDTGPHSPRFTQGRTSRLQLCSSPFV